MGGVENWLKRTIRGSPWGGHAANVQMPQSWHLAPCPLL